MYLCVYLSVCLSVYLSTYLSIYLSISVYIYIIYVCVGWNPVTCYLSNWSPRISFRGAFGDWGVWGAQGLGMDGHSGLASLGMKTRHESEAVGTTARISVAKSLTPCLVKFSACGTWEMGETKRHVEYGGGRGGDQQANLGCTRPSQILKIRARWFSRAASLRLHGMGILP